MAYALFKYSNFILPARHYFVGSLTVNSYVCLCPESVHAATLVIVLPVHAK